jgi:Rieske Fe-S protein
MTSSGSTRSASRRDFIKGAAIAIGGMIGVVIGVPAVAYLIAPALRSEKDDTWVDLGPLERYREHAPGFFEFTRTRVNGWERTSVAYGVHVVRQDAMSARVFSDICTHLGCRVKWHEEIRQYISPCHDGHFDLLGRNVSGPPPRPLDEFVTRIEDGRLWIQLPPMRRSA